MEAAAEQVVHSAGCHRVEGLHGHLHLASAQQELEHGRGRELRRVSETAPHWIELPAEPPHRVGQQRRSQGFMRRLGSRAQALHDRARIALDVGASVPPGVCNRLQELPEARQSMPRLGRVVRAAEEGLACRGQEDGHRPAAVSRERHDGVHVDGVEIRPLLPVDLDRDEVLVHQRRRSFVLERLVLHHVTPMARGVADREQDRLVLFSRARECLVPPRMPVHGIVGVLQEVGARLPGETVHGVTVATCARAEGPRHRP